MSKEFTPETVNVVLGKVRTDLPDKYEVEYGIIAKRTPLHVDYGRGPGFAPSREAASIEDADEFNAVGSRVNRSSTDLLAEAHLPVLDLDGGAKVQVVKAGSKAILYANPVGGAEREKLAGKYGPSSMLRDVLGDNGIDVEVFQSGVQTYSPFTERSYYHGNRVVALALRTKEPEVFVAIDSTQEGHSHLYIQQPFSAEDHKTLIDELGNTGVVSEHWQQLTAREGMGIVRTPWTKRKGIHKRT